MCSNVDKAEKPIRTFLHYIRPYVRAYAVGIVCLIISIAGFAATPWLLRLAVNTLEQRAGMTALTHYLVMVIAVTLCACVARFFSRKLFIYTSRDIEYDIRNDVFEHLLHMDMGFFGRWRTGDIMSRSTDDLAAVRMFMGPGLMLTADTLVTVPIAVTMMLMMSGGLTLLAMLPLPVISAVVCVLGRIVHTRSRRLQEQRAALADRARENLTGIRVVKSYACEEYEIERFEAECHENLRRNMSCARIDSLFWPLISFFAGSSMTALMFFGGRATIRGVISLGDFVAFAFYVMMLYWPMAALGWVVNLYQRATAAMIRVNELLAEQPDIDDRGASPDATWPDGDIEFCGVTVQYPDTARPALNDITVRIPAGATAAIVGSTGSGKSSLITLIPRLQDPMEGEVRIGGHDVRELPLEELRRNIGYVPQETFLFSETLRENVAFGISKAEDGRLISAAEVAQLNETINGLPEGFSSMLGERGVNLSGGEKQRATLARALAIDPPVLILDDAMSSVDTHTEEAILNNIRALRAGRTTVLISHRISTVQQADVIVVLADGRIAEQGTHDELLRRRGLYAEMYEMQRLEEELEKT